MYGNYDYNLYRNMSSGAIIFVSVLYLALIILAIVAMWRIFTKAGEKGWKCLIPVYGAYVEYKIGWEGK